MILGFTGHRPPKAGGWGATNPVRDRIFPQLLAAIDHHKPTHAISGMALGVDQWAAWACVLRGVPFTAAVPFRGQENRWNDAAQAEYRDLLTKAAFVHVVEDDLPEHRTVHAYFTRNEWIVDHCDLLIAVYDSLPSGGTAQTVRHANAVGKPVVIIPLGAHDECQIA